MVASITGPLKLRASVECSKYLEYSKVPDQLNRPTKAASTTHKLYRVAKLLKKEIKQCKGILSYNSKNIVPKELYLLLRRMTTNDDAVIDIESSCNNHNDEKKVNSL